MTERILSSIKFVGLHAHSTAGSPFDALGFPDEHMDFAYQNGAEALALTDHGNCNGLPYQVLHAKKMRKEGKEFKSIFGCLLKGQEILTKDGIKEVQNIQVGDEVFTHKGRFRKVLSTMSRHYEGKLYEVHLKKTKRTLKLTEEHPIFIRDYCGVFSWKKPNEIDFGRFGSGNQNWNKRWKSFVCLPKTTEQNDEVDLKEILKDHFEFCGGFVKKEKSNKFDSLKKVWSKLPPVITVDPEWSYFLGLFTAEGSIRHKNNKITGVMTISLHLKESVFASKAKKMLDRLGISYKETLRENKSIREIVFCYKPLAFFLEKVCGGNAKTKKVPWFMFSCSRENQQSFIQGLLDGDGKKGNKNSLKVSSRDLAWGFRTLLSSFGFWSSVCEGKERGVFSFYYVSYSPNRKWSRSFDDENFTFKGIKNITSENYSGMVYNFEVEEDNSYVSDFALHNCEAYYHPSIAEWKKLKEEREKKKKLAKDETSGAVMENEEETKKGKGKDPLKKRGHLVLLAKNQTGLNNIFSLVSRSFQNGHFYNFPRIDLSDLEEFGQGVIGLSACVSGDALLETSHGIMRLDKLIEKLKKGEELFVLSYNEKTKRCSFEKVLWGEKTRKNAKVFQIKTKDGKTLRLTGDHKVFTDSGWKRTDELTKKDKILKLEYLSRRR